MSLPELLQRADLWRGGDSSLYHPAPGLPSGHAELDAQLPGGGWPRGALTEILLPATGTGELALLMPTLSRLTREDEWVAFVAPPHLPYAPALAAAGIRLERILLIRPPDKKQTAWALEQTLRARTCGAVLGWLPEADMRGLRRLQLAAEAGEALGVLFRPPTAAAQPSPAALRLQLEATPDGSLIHVLKRRGGWGARPVRCPRPHAVA